jgi:hypothetical protein
MKEPDSWRCACKAVLALGKEVLQGTDLNTHFVREPKKCKVVISRCVHHSSIKCTVTTVWLPFCPLTAILFNNCNPISRLETVSYFLPEIIALFIVYPT